MDDQLQADLASGLAITRNGERVDPNDFYAPHPLDSKAGMERFAEWARAHHIVLYPYHERLAKKHGVSLDGIVVMGMLPTA